MLHTMYRGNPPTGTTEEKCCGVLTKYGRGGHLGYVSSIMSSNFLSLYLKAFIQNLVQKGKVISEKIRFEFVYVHDLGPRSRNDLDLQYY